MTNNRQDSYIEYTHRYWDKHNGLLMGMISGIVALGTTLILGSYGYTWIEIKTEQEEKRVWRKDFKDALDAKFAEVTKGQAELSDKLHASDVTTKTILSEILAEQKRQNRRGDK